MVNYVKEIYAPFTDEEISAKMVELLTPKGTKAKVQIVYQPLEGLHEAYRFCTLEDLPHPILPATEPVLAQVTARK